MQAKQRNRSNLKMKRKTRSLRSMILQSKKRSRMLKLKRHCNKLLNRVMKIKNKSKQKDKKSKREMHLEKSQLKSKQIRKKS